MSNSKNKKEIYLENINSKKENSIFKILNLSTKFEEAMIDTFEQTDENLQKEELKKTEEFKKQLEMAIEEAASKVIEEVEEDIKNSELNNKNDEKSSDEKLNENINNDINDETSNNTNYENSLEHTVENLSDEKPNETKTENRNEDNETNENPSKVEKPTGEESTITENEEKKKMNSTQKKLFLVIGFIVVVIGLTFGFTKIKPSEKKEEVQIASKSTAIKLDDIEEKKTDFIPTNDEITPNEKENENSNEIKTTDEKEIDDAINNIQNDAQFEEQPTQEKPPKIAIMFFKKPENENRKENGNNNTNKNVTSKNEELATDNRRHNKLKKFHSPYEVKQGSVLPAILITEINTDLPGTILGQIRENVYDTVTGEYLLIPKGSKLFGRYENQISSGQNRVLIVWDKLILPNGKYLDLVAMQGADNMGNSGLKDGVNRHIIALLGRSLLSSVLNIGNNLSKNISFGIAGKQFGLNGQIKNGEGKESSPFEQATGKILQQGVDRKPTITIRKGFKFNVIVNEDLELEPYKY